MADAPETIWTKPCADDPKQGRWWVTQDYHREIPYRRADLPRPEDAARIAELEAALARISMGSYDGLEVTPCTAKECRSIARAALDATEGKDD